jgi:kynurenine formamidase
MEYIDLTHLFKAEMPVFPGDDPSKLEQTEFIGKHECNGSRVETGMHVGTHMDAPSHMIKGAKMLMEYPAEKFFGPGVLIDARGKESIDVCLLEGKNIPTGAIVLIMTGFSKKFNDLDYYETYPEITTDFAHKMVELGVSIVGMDTPSPDRSPYEIHKILLKKDVLIIENLNNLEALLPHDKFNISALPTKFEAEAAPTRVVAQV